MTKTSATQLNRRAFVAGSAALIGAPALAQTQGSIEIEQDISSAVRRNISSFRSLDWRPYFNSLSNGAILVDITSRALHYWSQNGETYRLYPTSVPLTEDLTRRGRTSVIRMAPHAVDEKAQSRVAGLRRSGA